MQFKNLAFAASLASVAVASYSPPVYSVAAPVPTSMSPVWSSPAAPAPACPTCPVCPATAPVQVTSYTTVTSVSYVTVSAAPATSTPVSPVYSTPAPYPTPGTSIPYMPTGTGVPTSYSSPSYTPAPYTAGAAGMSTNVIVAGLSAVLAAFALV